MKTSRVIKIVLKCQGEDATSARREAARLWNRMVKLHRWFRQRHKRWPTPSQFEKHFKGRFTLHSQTVQALIQKFFANIETTRTNRKQGNKKARYPYKLKTYVAVPWKGQAVKHPDGCLILPMGREREPLQFTIPTIPVGKIAQVELGYRELRITLTAQVEPSQAGDRIAAADLGIIHLGAVTTGEQTVVVVGRGLRSISQGETKTKAEIAALQSRCQKGSRRWRKLRRAKGKYQHRAAHRKHNLLHHAAHEMVKVCQDNAVGTLVVGDITEIARGKKKKMSKRTNQENSNNPLGKLVQYLEYKGAKVGVQVVRQNEAHTTKTCPVCGHRHKPAGRVYRCPVCGFVGVRDEVGAVNILNKYLHGEIVPGFLVPNGNIKYLRPVALRQNVVAPLAPAHVACSTPELGAPVNG